MTTYRKAKELIQQNLSEEQRNKLSLGTITIPEAYRQLKNQERRQDLLSNAVISNIQFPDNIHLIEGDFIEKCKDIPDNSIDLIFTDPPYQRGWLSSYFHYYLYLHISYILHRLLQNGWLRLFDTIV